MKRIAIIAALLLAASCSPKIAPTESAATDTDLYDFHRDGNNVSWAKVYYYDAKDEPKVREWLRRSFSITEDGEKMKGQYKGKLPREEVGIPCGKTVVVLLKPSEVDFVAEFREGRMRVVVDRITWYYDTELTARSGMFSVSQPLQPSTLNDIAITCGRWAPAFLRSSGNQLQLMLEYLFTPRKSTLSDEW